jgi:hypothetical protein
LAARDKQWRGAIKTRRTSFHIFQRRRQRGASSSIFHYRAWKKAFALPTTAIPLRREIGTGDSDSYILFARNLSLHVFPFYSTAVLLARVSISFIGRPYRPLRLSSSFYFHPPSFVMRRTSKRDRRLLPLRTFYINV